jgi:succinate dehydrogenase / fumarate reductase iron-sulfur subunit
MTQEFSHDRRVTLRIRRQDRPGTPARWEVFAVPYRPNMNVIACLQYIAAHSATAEGRQTTPVVYESGCLEEVCGACTRLINGKTRQACSALVEKLQPVCDRGNGTSDQPITLEPLTKFPVIRDLSVDRRRLFDDLKRTKCWVPIDGTYDLGPGPAISQQLQEERYVLSRCISCASCLEACPQYAPANQFVGAAVFSQVKLFNSHPTGRALIAERLHVMMGEGGISDCSKAGNCVVVCPKNIPNLESIATVGRQTALSAIGRFFNG